MGDCGEVWIFDSRYDWEDVIGMEIEDAKFGWGVSAKHRKSKFRMHNFNEKHPQVIENVGCR